MQSSNTETANCPHRACKAPITLPDPAWFASAPWSCSSCGNLYGIGKDGLFPIPTDFRPLSPLYDYEIASNFSFYSGDLYYVYALCYSSGLPFYVGKGRGKRPVTHLWEANYVKNKSEKHEIILEHKRLQQPIWYHFYALTESQKEAFNTEAYIIRKYGLRGIGGMLTNSDYPKPMGPPLETFGVVLDEVPDFTVEGRPVRFVTHPTIKVTSITDRPKSIWLLKCHACGRMCKHDKATTHAKLLCQWCGHYIDLNGIREIENIPIVQFNSFIDEIMKAESAKLNAARP
jgi:hypothetical protein